MSQSTQDDPRDPRELPRGETGDEVSEAPPTAQERAKTWELRREWIGVICGVLGTLLGALGTWVGIQA